MDVIKNLIDRVVRNPALVVGVVIAALNATTVQTWQGYAAAVLAALVRWFVKPVYDPLAKGDDA